MIESQVLRDLEKEALTPYDFGNRMTVSLDMVGDYGKQNTKVDRD